MADTARGTVATTDDWPAEAADTIVRVVGTVRDKTTGPAVKVAHVLVYGLLAAILGVAVLVLISILLVRILDAYLPSSWFGSTHTWLAHLIVGGLFLAFGLLLWWKRRPKDD